MILLHTVQLVELLEQKSQVELFIWNPELSWGVDSHHVPLQTFVAIRCTGPRSGTASKKFEKREMMARFRVYGTGIIAICFDQLFKEPSKGNPTYPWEHTPPNERNSFINCWLGVWGMLRRSVGKVLETLFPSTLQVIICPICFQIDEVTGPGIEPLGSGYDAALAPSLSPHGTGTVAWRWWDQVYEGAELIFEAFWILRQETKFPQLSYETASDVIKEKGIAKGDSRR